MKKNNKFFILNTPIGGKIKNLFINSSIVFFSLLITILAAEISLKSYHWIRYHGNKTQHNVYIQDNVLGWRPAESWVINRLHNKVEYTKNVFRLYGKADSSKKKIMILGDSYTHAVDLPIEGTYCSRIKEALDIEVFASGVGGYGTLQEYLILDNYADEIKPDAVIIQFCSNDFFNNHFELERQSNAYNNRSRRPYLTKDKKIIYRDPGGFGGSVSFIQETFLRKSELFLLLQRHIGRLKAKASGWDDDSVEKLILKKGKAIPSFAEAVEITEEIFTEIRQRVPVFTKIFVFSADDWQPYHDELIGILKGKNIDYIDGIPQAIEDAKQKGLTVNTPDNIHWNETGHKIVGDILVTFLKEKLANPECVPGT